MSITSSPETQNVLDGRRSALSAVVTVHPAFLRQLSQLEVEVFGSTLS